MLTSRQGSISTLLGQQPVTTAANATKLLAKEARLRHLAATKTGREAVAVFAKEWHGLVRTRRRTLDLLFG
jgi:hypothetical protein